jgi:hypothetical protein
MRNLRTFSQEFKRQVVEELMSGESRPAQLMQTAPHFTELALPLEETI